MEQKNKEEGGAVCISGLNVNVERSGLRPQVLSDSEWALSTCIQMTVDNFIIPNIPRDDTFHFW